jgi:HEAT repeat protein
MIMKCEENKTALPEYIDGKLDKNTSGQIRDHLENCDGCKALFKELNSFLKFVGSFSEIEPPEGMKEEFLELSVSERIPVRQKVLVIPFWVKVAAVVVLVFGTFLGYLAGSIEGNARRKQLASQLKSVKQEVSLASLREFTGPQKIEAVYNISASNQASDELIDALVHTMNSDKNVNVRLAAINALSGMINKNKHVKTELIHSLSVQENSLLQISLIQVLTEGGVKEAKEEIESVSKSEKTDESVKVFAKDMIKIII